MKPLKVAIVANCQARPLATILVDILACEVNIVAIVHLLKNDDLGNVSKKLHEADFILSQLISDDYPIKFISTSILREQFGSKLITIPNLYYMGYTPDLRYLRIPGERTLQGPLGDYHSQIIFDSWIKGISIEDTVSEYKNLDNWSERYSNVHETSINQLKLKEQDTDISISDVIREKSSAQRLFFTFNHPSHHLLIELLKRVINLIGLYSQSELNKKVIYKKGHESLNQFIVPLSDFVINKLGIGKVSSEYQIFQGMKKDSNSGRFIKVQYDIEQLITEFFKDYDNNQASIKKLLVKNI